MKKIIFITVVSLFAFGCDSSTETPKNSNSGNVSKANANNTAASASPAPAPHSTNDTSSVLKELKTSDGKYVTDLKLWDNSKVAPRLEKIMGPDFAGLKKHWNTQTAIQVDGDIIMTTGCEQHNCGPNQYVLLADTAKDIIHVVHIKDGKVKEYKETGEITLPKAFADDLAKMKDNSK